MFVSELTPTREPLYRWIPFRLGKQIAYQLIKSFDMAAAVLTARNPKAILIFEHKPQYAMVLYAVCLARRVPIFFFFSHGLQQLQGKSVAHRLGFVMLQKLVSHFAFWPIHLERDDSVLPDRLRYKKSFVLPHPLPLNCLKDRKPFNKSRIRLGIVGMLRPDKPILPLAGALRDAFGENPNYELRIATPFWQVTDDIRRTGIELVDTSSDADYANFMQSCDIILADFEKASFYFRVSGIINDALASGCYVIAPAFPVFEAQLAIPCQVGATYNELSDIAGLVQAAVNELKSDRIDFERWRDFRRGAHLLDVLGAKTDRVVAAFSSPH